MKKVTKAVFPVAGLGSRFLPATKAQPKEMLPVVDKPLIQYAVEEAVSAGITEMIFITGRNKRAIEDHFDKAYELESELEAANKDDLLKLVREVVPSHINCIYIRQQQPLGLGHAVLCARPVVGNNPFAVILADDFMDVRQGQPTVMQQMAEVYEREEKSILAVLHVPRESTKQYGIVASSPYMQNLEFVNTIVEKPKPEDAPSNMAVVGRYILNASIFDHLDGLGKGSGGEIQLTDGIAELMKHEKVLAYRYHGRRYDCGSKLGYLKATVAMGLKHPEVMKEFIDFIAELNVAQR
ncbi:UTP--glucose-1-phosphate uridylyltransferase GalU [Oxalobacter vibrioformis]|uniref:UTP--glucose-1-phosphate uridylyltransferase n=1 Tax=Oxalobacter vibrioformis TaxID=933080 RepID=A0A9E9LYB7_9BURK|nr:UTP--glucose-1-phosphate uridylyltransferase GalU [Oxalobacter vibrioformis]WAW10616.1 UTP--glucose-1-phosphate uridylyltransferase GalU [Oxalobacter vibrioformis]